MASFLFSPPRALALAAALLALLGLGFFVAASFAADEEKGVLADVLSRALSTPATEVSIGGIDGALSSDATIRDLKISDRDGVWLTINRIRIVWRRLALLQRRLEIDKLDIDQMNVARKQIPAEAPVSGEEQPLLPELPLRVDIKQFSLARVDFGQPVLGVASSFSTGGNATLGPPTEGLRLFLDAQRLDRPAALNVRLNLVPDSQHLDLSVNLDEPAGGILSHLANIPGRPPVKLSIIGSGAHDAFNAKLAFDAGQSIGATGDASLNREGAGRRLGLDLAAEVSGLLPQMAAPVFAGTTELAGNVFFGDDSAVAIPGVELIAAAARLDVTGGLSAEQIADIRISARNVPNAESHTALKEAEIRRLGFDAHVTGALGSPTIDSTLEVEDARLPSASLSHLDASFKAAPTGSIANASTLLQLAADAKVRGLSLANPAFAQAIGSEATFAMRGASTIKGLVDFQTLEIKSPTLSAGFKGRAGPAELKGLLDVAAPDVARFGAVAGFALKGEATLKADIEGTPRSNRFTAKIDALANRFTTGVAPIDGLYGGKLTLAGGARLDADGGFGFTDLRVTGPNASARVDGAATPKLTDLAVLMTIPELSNADKRAKGRGEIAAHVTGTLSLPDAAAKISIRDAALLGRPVPRLDVRADATNLRGALDAHVTLDGEIDRKPARGSLHIARPAAGGAVLDGVDVSIGSVSAQGEGALDAANFAAGQFALHARDLDDLSPLALQKLSGGIDADVTLTRADARQDAAIKANGQRIEAFGLSLDKLAADLALTDVYRRPVIAGSLAVDEARIGGETVSHVRLNAKGGVDASDITLTATARGLNLDARARVVPADPIRIEITKSDATRGRSRIGLAGPATVVIKDGGADLRNLSLSLSGGRLTIEGRAGSKLDLKAIARAVPLSAADILAPDLGLSGNLDGEATVTGPLAAPAGAYRFKIAKLAAPQARTIGLPLIDVDATGRIEGARTTLEATLAAGQAGRLKISGSAPLATEGALDLAIKGNLDAGLANRSMSAAGRRRLTGSVAVDGRLGGTAPQPRAYGSITLSNGSLQDAILGIRLDAIRARLIAQGDRATIESASATTRNGGSITAGGSIRLDPIGGFPSDIRIRGQNAELMQSALATAVLGLALDISGPLARYPRIGGKVDINSLDIAIPDRLPGSLQPLPGTRHIDPTPTAAARLAIAAKSRKGRGAPALDAALDLTIAVPGQIRVRGRGLDAQLGGNLRLTGTLAQPKPVGAFNLVRGRLNILTSELDLTRANLTFAGDLSPALDFLATTQAGGASVSIAITGNPADPQFIFRSSPDLPQDEILSRLLFGAPSGQLSPTQALALGQTAAIYSGGNDTLEGLRRSLGLGAASNSNNPLNNFLGDRVSLGVHTGATPAQTGVGMSVTIYKQLKGKGAIDATGGASAGVGAEYEW
jgi:translocation and assembly module TamB